MLSLYCYKVTAAITTVTNSYTIYRAIVNWNNNFAVRKMHNNIPSYNNAEGSAATKSIIRITNTSCVTSSIANTHIMDNVQ